MNIKELRTKKIAILGFGKEGKSTLSFLQKIDCEDITIIDRIQNIEYRVQDFRNFKIITGENYLDNLEIYDYIFKSPGISLYINNLQKYKSKIWSQTKLFFEFYSGKIISVTQTKGKSTIVTLLYNLLKNAGYNVKLVGNIGNPVLDEIDLEDKYDYVIYELSSYMLEDLDNHHSYISIIGNIYEDHLDWHQGFENYKNAKLNILKNAENLLVGEKLSLKIKEKLKDKNYKTFGLETSYYSNKGNDFFINGEKLKQEIKPIIPGEHNLSNICSILGICNIIKIDFKILKKTINTFLGLPYRLQNIGNYNGITFIDDANATTPEASIAAIKAFGSKVETIFLGGSDRGYNFKDLIQTIIDSNIKNIVFFPESGIRIFEELNIFKGVTFNFNYIHTTSMQEAVEFAYKNTSFGKICLLSCASPSYSLWKNFEEKGDEFKKEILKLGKK